MTLNEYQQKAMTTCLPESDNLFYMLANLCGEVGEFASKAGKHMRNWGELIEVKEVITSYGRSGS